MPISHSNYPRIIDFILVLPVAVFLLFKTYSDFQIGAARYAYTCFGLFGAPTYLRVTEPMMFWWVMFVNSLITVLALGVVFRPGRPKKDVEKVDIEKAVERKVE